MIKKISITIISIVFLPSLIFAAILDELNHPLVSKGQWVVDAELDIYDQDNKVDVEPNQQVVVAGFFTGTKDFVYKYDYTRYKLSPGIIYGLTDNLQLKFNFYYNFPYDWDYTYMTLTNFAGIANVPTTRYHYSQTDIQEYEFSQELKYRPTESSEYFLSAAQHKSKYKDEKEEDTAFFLFPFPVAISDGSGKAVTDTHTLTLGGTWLTNPKASFEENTYMPDLDGLKGPLLDKAQAKLYLDLKMTWQESVRGAYSDPLNFTNQMLPDNTGIFFAGRIAEKMHSVSFMPKISYGLNDTTQIDFSWRYWFPYHKNYNEETILFGGSRPNLTTMVLITDATRNFSGKYKYYSQFNPALKITRRYNPQLEVYLDLDYLQYKDRFGGSASLYVGAIAPAVVGGVFFPAGGQFYFPDVPWPVLRERVKNTNLTLGGTWVSFPKLKIYHLLPDMDGLKGPLLEKGQIRVDASLTKGTGFYKYSFEGNSPGSYVYNYRFYNYTLNSALSYGLKNNFQIGLNLSYRFPYRYSWDFANEVGLPYNSFQLKFRDYWSSGLQVKYRPLIDLETRLSATYTRQAPVDYITVVNNTGVTALNYTSQEREQSSLDVQFGLSKIF